MATAKRRVTVGYVAVKTDIVGAVDHSHPAVPDRASDRVGAADGTGVGDMTAVRYEARQSK